MGKTPNANNLQVRILSFLMSTEQVSLPFGELNDTEFINTLCIEEEHKYPLQILNNMIFHPFDFDEDSISLDNYLICQGLKEPICNYYFWDDPEFENILHSCELKFLSYNINSLPLHLDTFYDQCLNVIGRNFDIIGFCETRLNDEISALYHLSGYNAFFKNKTTKGGGVALYIAKYMKGVIRQDLSLQLSHIESLFIECTRTNKFLVGMIYRPPNASLHDFMLSLEQLLEHVTSEQTLPCYLMGDLNVNLLKQNDNSVNELLNLFYTYSYFPVITKPTRVTSTSASLIDHIWTNDLNNYQASGIMYTSISDHFPVFSSFSVPQYKSHCPYITITKRIINNEFINAFKTDLIHFSWVDEVKGKNVNDCFEFYLKNFINLYNKNFPIKQFTVKEEHSNKPYITSAIRTSIKQRNRLQKLYAKWPLTYEASFKSYRNQLTTIIRAAKEKYYTSKLKEQAGNPKKTWETINGLMGRNKNLTSPPSITLHDRTTSNSEDIAEGFNEYFCNVANTLAQVRSTPVSYNNFLPEPTNFSFFLRPTTTAEINSIIHELKVTSPGHDDINIKIIKECRDEISPFLKYIINESFKEGSFPKHLQIAKVVPIFKKGDASMHTNYRPISVLPSFSKIFEKVVVVRLMDYLNQHTLLTDSQYGFRPKRSTELALHHLSQCIYTALDTKVYQLTVFCDLTKAFDTIPHFILLQKLLVYGIRGPAFKWFQSYLSQRKQYVVYGNKTSSQRPISCGVPQGSILGPVLFLIYINDITRSSDKLNFLLFADDTTIFIQGQDIFELRDTVNRELLHVSNWLKSNKLTLNISKTHFMVSHTNMMRPPDIEIKIDNHAINQTNETRFLGIIFDSKLNWHSHLYDLRIKISKISGVLYKIRHFLNSNCLRQIYLSIVYPHLLYCSAIWGGTHKTYLDTIFIAQKKLIRIMFHKQRYDHTNPLFSKNKILKFHDIIHLQTCLFVFKAIFIHQVDCGFRYISHSIDTRRTNDLRLPLYRTSHAQQSVTFRGAKVWNKLQEDFKHTMSLNSFSYKIKAELFRKYN